MSSGRGSGRGSERRRTAARITISEFNRTGRHLAPRCGAHARSTGQPCRRFAMANGRCDRHGGKVPKGKGWHKATYPKGTRPQWDNAFHGKLAALEKRKRRQDARREAMTPEQKAAHDKWHKSHRPGDPKARSRTRARRKQDAEAAALIARPEEPRTPTPEEMERTETLERLRAELRRLDSSTHNEDGGIFS